MDVGLSNTDHDNRELYLANILTSHGLPKGGASPPRHPSWSAGRFNFVIRQSIRIDDSAVLLGFIGSIFPWHGVDLIIDSVALLRKRGRNVQAIVGDGAILEELQSLAEFHNLKEAIHFIDLCPSGTHLLTLSCVTYL